MSLLNWTFTLIGIGVSLIALLFALFQYTNKEGSHKTRAVKKSMYLGTGVLLVFYIIGIFAWVEPNKIEIPLSPEEKGKFKTSVFSIAGIFRLNPILQAPECKNTLENLVKYIQQNPMYEKEMPHEVAVLYRLYGVSILVSALNSRLSLDYYIKQTSRYLEKSFNLDPSLWRKEHEKSSYEFFKKLARSNEDPKMDDFFRAIFSIAMVSANESEVKNSAEPILTMLHRRGNVLLGKPKTDYEFFQSFRGKSNLNYGQWIEFVRITVEGKGGRFEGPIYDPAENGRTSIKCTAFLNDESLSLEWLVDKNENLIEPKTEPAKEIHDLVVIGQRKSNESPLIKFLITSVKKPKQ